MKRLFMTLAFAAALAGCGSNVKLDDVPVEDRSGTAATPPGGGAAPQSGVAPVVADMPSGANTAPQGVGRVVYFDYDSYVVKTEFQPLIETHAKFLKASSARRVVIEGHTDERGGREYNLALGQRRAEAVRRSLGLLGVGDNQVEAVSFGKEKPAATGTDEASWAQNRRAELSYR